MKNDTCVCVCVDTFKEREKLKPIPKITINEDTTIIIIFASLENNQMTCMASDQVPANGLGTYSTFFGHECYSFALAPKLARKSKKQILMSYLSYEKDIGHVINFVDPNKEIYNENGVDVMNLEMENQIKKSPAEYSWEYKKFRRIEENKDLYNF